MFGALARPLHEMIRSATVREDRKISKKVNMLTPSCTYVFWFVASNSDGTVESAHAGSKAAGGKPGPKEYRR
jgi:hypothetical protein